MKIQKVVFVEKRENFYHPDFQCESIAASYMNTFAIDEDNQFEIAAIETLDQLDRLDGNAMQKKFDKAMQTVENLTKQQNEGMDCLHRIPKYDIRLFKASDYSLQTMC